MSDTPKTADLKSPAELQKRLLHLERDQGRYAADRSRVEQRLKSVRAALAVAPQVEQALQLDIRSVHQGRGQAKDETHGQEYSMRFDTLRVDFVTHTTHVLITRCEVVAPGGGSGSSGSK